MQAQMLANGHYEHIGTSEKYNIGTALLHTTSQSDL